MHKAPFGWGDFKGDGKISEKMWERVVWFGEERGRDFGGAKVISPWAHQNPLSPIWGNLGRFEEKK